MNDPALRIVRLGNSAVADAVAERPELQFLRKVEQVRPRLLFRNLPSTAIGSGMRTSGTREISAEQAGAGSRRWNLLAKQKFDTKGRSW